MDSLFYPLFALLGLSFLIFIHELGHYIMARRVKMKVEVFSVGFGHPIFSFMRDGVKFQIGWIPFGGYVKIAGTDPEKGVDPYLIKDGFFGKTPWDRLKVAFAGPFVNIVFAFLMFFLLFLMGGREKNFSEYTSRIGWIDPKSELYEKGVRPGDQITAYAGSSFESSKDHLYRPMTANGKIEVSGFHVDDIAKTKTPFNYFVDVYPHPLSAEKGLKTVGILQSGSYLKYEKPAEESLPFTPKRSFLLDTLKDKDRLLAVDGELLFSEMDLTYLLNSGKALLTVEREGKVFLARVPRIALGEYRLTATQRQEISDWEFDANLRSNKKKQIVMIPYDLNAQGVVEGRLAFIDKEKEMEAFPPLLFSERETPLEMGDKIIAVDGVKVTSPHEILAFLQNKKVALLIERNQSDKVYNSKEADKAFNQEINGSDFEAIFNSFGTSNSLSEKGDFILVSGISPKPKKAFISSEEAEALYQASLEEQKKWVRNIADPEKRKEAMQFLDKRENTLVLGIPAIADQKVNVNLPPQQLFVSVVQEILGTLKALVTGSLNPKWMSGPIGIVQLVQQHWAAGLKEGIFWLGAISLNLGILNLVPIPVLDGGTILISFIEMVTKKRMSVKTLEKLTLPFGILLMGFFIFLTYNDLFRIFSKFF